MTRNKVSKLLSKKEISAQMDELISKLVARDKTLDSLEKSADGFRELISRTKKISNILIYLIFIDLN